MSTAVDRALAEETAALERELALTRPQIGIGRIATILLPLGLVGLTAAVHIMGFARSPMFFDDEGTYASQAWAVTHLNALSPYTYWYDHPPLGWLILDIFEPFARAAGVSGSLDQARAVMSGVFAVTALLVYVVARRFGLRVQFAGLAVILFALSPLSLHFQRMVLLDNLAAPFVLGAFALAVAPRRGYWRHPGPGLWMHAGAGACLALAVLCKETTAAFAPALCLLLWRSSHPATRRYALTVATSLFVLICLYYPLYAALNSELIPGKGHVSLVGALRWQLFDRPTSGWLVDRHSLAWQTVTGWTSLDHYLLLGGIAGMAVCAFSRRAQPLALALGVQIAILFKPGYLPELFVVASLPFAALLAAAALDIVWGSTTTRPGWGRRRMLPLRLSGPALAIAITVGSALVVVPSWANSAKHSTRDDENASYRGAIAYVLTHVPRADRLLVDDVAWMGLIDGGYPRQRVVWMYKLDLDPAVQCRYRDGWRDFDYILRSGVVIQGSRTLPQTRAALAHAHVVAAFGSGPTAISVMHIDGASPHRSSTPAHDCAAIP